MWNGDRLEPEYRPRLKPKTPSRGSLVIEHGPDFLHFSSPCSYLPNARLQPPAARNARIEHDARLEGASTGIFPRFSRQLNFYAAPRS